MERIYYAGSSFLTGNDIAQALVRYAKFLVAHRSTASINIPVRNPDGTDGRASFLLGPTSELVSQTELSVAAELEDGALVSELQDRSSGLSLSNPGSMDLTQDSEELGRYFDTYDLREYV